jgi:outer membrane protein OmpA-like peptidoglycan-associated protein
VFFQKGKASLNKEFRNILENFFPRYINVIHSKYKLNIEEIRIEGYTSSEWTGSNNELDSYFNNMKLSQERTRNVLQYVMNLEKTNYCQDWLIEHLTANGMSYSHRYFNENGEEDMEKSRRVEFKIRTNADKIISEIIEQYKEKNGD